MPLLFRQRVFRKSFLFNDEFSNRGFNLKGFHENRLIHGRVSKLALRVLPPCVHARRVFNFRVREARFMNIITSLVATALTIMVFTALVQQMVGYLTWINI